MIRTDTATAGFDRIVPPESNVDVIFQGMYFGEGPVWNAREGSLYWVDIIGSKIWKWTPTVGAELVMSPTGHANGMTLDAQGRLVVAGWGSRSIWRRELDGSATTLVSSYRGVRLNTPNDIVVKSDGSIYFTDPSRGLFIPGMGGEHGEDLQRYLDNHPVFRLSPDGELTEIIGDIVYPNGLCFSPDESLLYVNDTDSRLIRVYTVMDDGSVTGGDVFCRTVGTDPGNPDGMKVDVEGNIYVTGPGGIHVFAPDGSQLGRLVLPDHATNFCFGGDDLKTMYLTSYSAVYQVRLGIAGIPVGLPA
jgi:gluconolactonase